MDSIDLKDIDEYKGALILKKAIQKPFKCILANANLEEDIVRE